MTHDSSRAPSAEGWARGVSAAVEALEQIAHDRLPCRKCGAVHVERVLETKDGKPYRVSWADPVDDHPYSKFTPKELAERVLNGRP